MYLRDPKEFEDQYLQSYRRAKHLELRSMVKIPVDMQSAWGQYVEIMCPSEAGVVKSCRKPVYLKE